MNEFVSSVLPFFQLLISFCTLVGLMYTFKKFVDKPKDDINSKIAALEKEIKEMEISIQTEIKDIKDSLHHGSDKFREHDATNEVLIHSVLALIEFEMQYCLVEHKEMSDGLKQAKKDLNDFLSKK